MGLLLPYFLPLVDAFSCLRDLSASGRESLLITTERSSSKRREDDLCTDNGSDIPNSRASRRTGRPRQHFVAIVDPACPCNPIRRASDTHRRNRERTRLDRLGHNRLAKAPIQKGRGIPPWTSTYEKRQFVGSSKVSSARKDSCKQDHRGINGMLQGP
jgi:hypothetical protein